MSLRLTGAYGLVANNNVVANVVVANTSVTTNVITSNTVTSNTVTTNVITSNTVTSNTITVQGTITAQSLIVTGGITPVFNANNISANVITANTITSNVITSGVLNVQNTASFFGTQTQVAANLQNVIESVNVIATAAATTQPYYIANGAVIYHTTNATATSTVNLTYSPTATINSILLPGQSISIALLMTQGTTAFYVNVVQVDGTTTGVTTYWQGGTTPTAGNPSGVDVYTFTIIKLTATPTYTVLASQTKF